MTDRPRRLARHAALLLPLAVAGACTAPPESETHASLHEASGTPDEAPPDAAPDAAPPDASPPDAAPPDASPPEGPLFPPGEARFGKTAAEWTAAWWQWSLAIPRATNPMRGGACDQNQSGDVFFLAGNFGQTETRHCTIPAGKAIYFPIVNEYCKNAPEASCSYVTDEAGLFACSRISSDLTMSLSIDGVPIEGLTDYRAGSEHVFYTSAPANVAQHVLPCIGPIRANNCGVPVGSERPIMTDGYWVMLRPLPPGPHTVRFAATLDPTTAPWSLDVTYQLDIAPAP